MVSLPSSPRLPVAPLALSWTGRRFLTVRQHLLGMMRDRMGWLLLQLASRHFRVIQGTILDVVGPAFGSHELGVAALKETWARSGTLAN